MHIIYHLKMKYFLIYFTWIGYIYLFQKYKLENQRLPERWKYCLNSMVKFEGYLCWLYSVEVMQHLFHGVVNESKSGSEIFNAARPENVNKVGGWEINGKKISNKLLYSFVGWLMIDLCFKNSNIFLKNLRHQC